MTYQEQVNKIWTAQHNITEAIASLPNLPTDEERALLGEAFDFPESTPANVKAHEVRQQLAKLYTDLNEVISLIGEAQDLINIENGDFE